jgi:hypothetical protein
MNDDFYDDFDDDFGDDGDSFSDDPDDGFEMDDSLDDDPGIEDKSTDDLCDDEFTTKEGVIFGMAMNFAYEEGLEEAERRRLEKKMDDDQDQLDNHS